MGISQMEVLNENRSFKRAYARGRYFVSPVLVTYCVKNGSKAGRFGITASKKIGKAVKRNRARRVIKEAYRSIFPRIKGGYDVVFVARGKTCEVLMDEVKKSMIWQIKKAGLWI